MKTSQPNSRVKVVVISGYFSPAHGGHIDYMRMAKEYAGPGGYLICIVNNDHQACLKKGYSFMPLKDRMAVVGAVRYVDEVVASIDTDRTVCQTIRMLCQREGMPIPTHFANGGDVTSGKSPEDGVCAEFGIEMVFDLGDKVQSSSWIIEAAMGAVNR